MEPIIGAPPIDPGRPRLVAPPVRPCLTGSWARDPTPFPNARLLELDGVGHFPYLETPDRFLPAVATLLAGGWPGGSRAVSAPGVP